MICADWVRDEEWLLDTIIGRTCATEDTMAPSRQDPVTGADGCTRL